MIAETDKWCDEACDRWYGENRNREPHFGQALAALRKGDPTGIDQALALASRRDDMTPAIARATALDNLAAIGDPRAAELGQVLAVDPSEHPMVRAAAIRTLRALPPTTRKRLLLPLLGDERRLVRREASQALADPEVYGGLTANERTRVDLSLREVQETLRIVADRGGAHMAWAGLCEQRGWVPEAIEAYETAIRVEPNMAGARTNLAALLDSLAERGDPRAASRAAELRQEELPLLARDAGLAPQNAQVQYRYGLALYLAGDLAAALRQLELAVTLAPDVEDYALALRLLREKLQAAPP